jgi:hypothetical protein
VVSQEEGDRVFGVLSMMAQAAGNGVDASTVEQTEGRTAEERAHDRSLPHMDKAGVFPEGDILGTVGTVLDQPMLPFEFEESLGSADGGWKTGDPIADLLVVFPVLAPGPFDPEDLSHTRPVGQCKRIGSDDDLPCIDPPMALLDCASRALIEQ